MEYRSICGDISQIVSEEHSAKKIAVIFKKAYEQIMSRVDKGRFSQAITHNKTTISVHPLISKYEQS